MQALKPCLLAVAAALGCATAAHAAKPMPDASAHDASSRGLQKNVVSAEPGVLAPDGRYRGDGTAISLYKTDFVASSMASASAGDAQRNAAAVASAYEYLTARRGVLGLSSQELADLQQTHIRRLPGLTVVRWQQVVQGLPVHGSDIAVSVRDDGNVIFVSNQPVSGLATVSRLSASSISADQAGAIARQYLGANARQSTSEDQMLYRDPQGVTHAVWRVRNGDWQVLVDRNGGGVVRAEDSRQFSDRPTIVSGWVFDPDPLSSARAAYEDPGYSDNDNSNSPQLQAQLKSVLLRDITFNTNKRTYRLTGPYADCRELNAPEDGACPQQKERNFLYTRDHLFFDAVNVYYHLDTYMRYVNNTLKIGVMPYQYKGGLRYDPHGVNGSDNSFYSITQGSLVFGQGGVDDAQDADVVIHELGHGLHDWLTDGNLSQVEGLSEGVGDYLAAGYSRDRKNQWTANDPAYYWVFSWDGHNEFWSGRVTNWHLDHTYPDTIGVMHTAGQYWASCNMVARDAIGGRDMDRAFLAGLTMTGSSSNQKDAAQAVINAAAAIGLSRAKVRAIGAAYNTSCNYNVTVPTV